MKKIISLLLVAMMTFQCINVVSATDPTAPTSIQEEESEVTDATEPTGEEVEAPETNDATEPTGEEVEAPETNDVTEPTGEEVETPESTDAVEPTDEETKAPEVEAPQKTDEEAKNVDEKEVETTSEDALELAYLKIEKKKLDLGLVQNVEVGIGNLPASYTSATLFIKSLVNSSVIEVASNELVDGIFSFDIEHYDLEGTYQLEKLSFENGKELSLILEDTSFTYDVFYNPDAVSSRMLDRMGPEEVDPAAIVETDIDAQTDSNEVAAAIDNSNANIMTRRAAPRAAGGVIIMLDPGHGSSDPGAIEKNKDGTPKKNGLLEKNLNWKISNYTKAYLEKYDVSVYLSRTENENPSTEERAQRGADKGASLFVSQHINAGGGSGAEVYVSKNPQYNSEGTKLGRKILDNLKSLGLSDRGVKTRLYNGGTVYNYNGNPDYYGVIRHSIKRGVPAILIEHAFIDSAQDLSKLKNEAMLKAMGEADAKALVEYYQLNLKGETPKPPTTTTPSILSQAHIANIGWNGWTSENGQTAGIAGRNLEALNLRLINAPKDAYIEANVYVQNRGWVNYKKISDGTIVGTTGQSRAIQALDLTLHNMPGYQIMYRIKMTNDGWQPWRYNDSAVGKIAHNVSIETVQFKLVKTNTTEPSINVNAHAAYLGWQGHRYAQGVAGTTGESRQLEALTLELQNVPSGAKITGSAHLAFVGWRNYSKVTYKDYIGTTGENRRIEAFNLKLEGVPGYHLEYRVHIAYEGWTSWIREGNVAGTTGKSRAIEAAEFRIVKN